MTFCVPVPAAGPGPVPGPPAPEVKASQLCQLPQPCPGPAGSVGLSGGGRVESGGTSFSSLRIALSFPVGFLSVPQGEDKVTGGMGVVEPARPGA